MPAKKAKLLIINTDEFQMYIDSSFSGISSTLKTSGKREPAFMWILRNHCNGRLAIDVGANIGYTTLSLCKGMEQVIAIEPDKRAMAILKKNIAFHNFEDKVELHNFAISDDNQEKVIYQNQHPNLTSLHAPKDKRKGYKEAMIVTRTIDSLGVCPDFIKMDIEGHEVEAIAGAFKTLARTTGCQLLIEVHPQYYSEQHSFADVLQYLVDELGFVFRYVVSAGVACPDLFKERGYEPVKVFEGDRYPRGLYEGVKSEDAIEFCAFPHKQAISYMRKGKLHKKYSDKIVRSVFLVKE